jgi:hypothetical protein
MVGRLLPKQRQQVAVYAPRQLLQPAGHGRRNEALDVHYAAVVLQPPA